jgi:N-acetylglucosamine-1-phosphate uridyltransferase (contains nucleotidyltransferase and I-patch acetyltransferase domains)
MNNLLNEYYFESIPEELKDLFLANKYTYDIVNGLKDYVISKTNGNNIIGENIKMHEYVVIEGPVIIGNNVEIMPGAYIRPYTIICDNAVIGHNAQIKESLILEGAKVQHLTFVGNSIIGNKARVGSGIITANRRFDQGLAGIKIDGNYYSLNTDFFGLVLGDKSRVGASCVTMPGTHIGPMTLVSPMEKVKGFVPRVKIFEDGKLEDGKEYDLK